MTFLSKARAFTLGNLHDLLDKAVDLNSPAVLKQYVRDLETAIAQLKSEAVIAAGGVRTINREIGDLQNKITAKTTAIKGRLAIVGITTTDPSVRTWAAEVTAWQKELAQKQADLVPQQETTKGLDQAVSKLEFKHIDMVANVRRLESAVHTTSAKNHAVQAMEQASSMSAGVDGVSIDNMQARINADKDVADEKFDRAMGSEAFAESPEKAGEVDAFLSTLK